MKFQDYLPSAAISYVEGLVLQFPVEIKVVPKRKTKHGDYRPLPNGKHRITLNAELNPYRFLITCIHEIAHLVAFQKYGRNIRPHGKEWKHVYRSLIRPLFHPDIFPAAVLPLLERHFQNPKAATDSDSNLVMALQNWDKDPSGPRVIDLAVGEKFTLENGRSFVKGPKRRTRFLCTELQTQKQFLVVGHLRVQQ